MKIFSYRVLFGLHLLIGFYALGQDSSSPMHWEVKSKRISNNQYELSFSTAGNKAWQIYAPNQVLGGVPTTELQFADSVMQPTGAFKDSGAVKKEQSALFGKTVKVYEGPAAWKQLITIAGKVPATLQGTFLYTYGRGNEFYPSTPYAFSVSLEGGVATTTKIIVPS